MSRTFVRGYIGVPPTKLGAGQNRPPGGCLRGKKEGRRIASTIHYVYTCARARAIIYVDGCDTIV